MPVAKWTLQLGATAKAIDLWGLSDLIIKRESFGIGTLTARAGVADVLADPICDFGTDAILRDPANVIRFRGRRVRHRAVASGLDESKFYVFADAWYDLGRRVFQQPWGVDATYTSHLLLNYNALAARIATTGEQVQAIIEYAQASGIAIQVGNLSLPVEPPLREITDQPCSAVIIDQVRYTPNAMGWIDYTFDPPAFHAQLPADLDTVTLPIFAANGAKVSNIDIEPLDEARVPAVLIHYEINNEVNGEQMLGFSTDIYPPGATGREENALVLTIPLQGFSATVVKGVILANDLDFTNLEFWKGQAKHSWLANPNISVAIATSPINGEAATARTGTKGLSRYLVEGQIASWMALDAGGDVDWEQEEVRIVVDVRINAGLNTLSLDEQVGSFQKECTLSVVSTDAPSGESNYSSLQSFEQGDPVPAGLAQYQYAALSGLEYSGSLTLTEAECSGSAQVGQLLNLIGGRAEWATMAARIQATEERIDTGETTITIGPTPVRSAQATLELMRANRSRRRWTALTTQSDGSVSAGGGEVELGQATPNSNSVPGPELAKYYAVMDGTKKVLLDATNMMLKMQNGTAQKLTLDYANAAWLAAKAKETASPTPYPGASEIKVREVFLCIDGDNTWKCILPAGAPYK